MRIRIKIEFTLNIESIMVFLRKNSSSCIKITDSDITVEKLSNHGDIGK